jgi:hypothetical protein
LQERNKVLQAAKSARQADVAADAGGSRAGLEQLRAQFEGLRKEKDDLDKVAAMLLEYARHPARPLCPPWTTKTVLDVVELRDDEVPPDGLEVRVLSLEGLLDRGGRPEKGEVAVLYRAPFPVDEEAAGRTAVSRKLDESGCVKEFGGHRQLHFIKRKQKSTARAGERKCLVVEVERKAPASFGGLFGGKVEIVARGALPLDGILSAPSLETVVPLHAPEAAVSADGFDRKRGAAEIAPGYPGPRGAVRIALRLNTPLRDPATKTVEHKKPVVTSWPPIVRAGVGGAAGAGGDDGAASPVAAPIPDRAPVVAGRGAAGGAAAAVGSAGVVAASAAAAAAAVPTPTPTPSSWSFAAKYPALAALNLDIYSPAFDPDDVSLYAGNLNASGAEMEKAAAAVKDATAAADAAAAVVARLRAELAAGPPKGVKAGDDADEWRSAKQLEITDAEGRVAASEQLALRSEARRAGLEANVQAVMGPIQEGKLTQEAYIASLDAHVRRDVEIGKACVEAAGQDPRPARGPGAAAAAAANPPWAVVTVVHPGTGRRVPLRYDPKLGKALVVERAKFTLQMQAMMRGGQG